MSTETANCADVPISTFGRAQQGQVSKAAEAHCHHLAELRSLEDEYRRKLQERKSSLEQAEEELLEADRHARIQLIERRKQHQAEMRALTQASKEELDRRRATLEEENTASIARWQMQLQADLEDKIATMQAAMKRQLDEARVRTADGANAQVAPDRPRMLQF